MSAAIGSEGGRLRRTSETKGEKEPHHPDQIGHCDFWEEMIRTKSCNFRLHLESYIDELLRKTC